MVSIQWYVRTYYSPSMSAASVSGDQTHSLLALKVFQVLRLLRIRSVAILVLSRTSGVYDAAKVEAVLM